MKLKTAQSRVRSVKGSSFLVKGADDYDHKGMNKARRDLDKALVAEGIDTTPDAFVPQKSTTTFRLVLWTQIRENYGSHCWDGEGECPQHWKCKGGEEYHVQIGTVTKVLELGGKGINAIATQVIPMVEKNDDYWQEWVLDWALMSDAEETSGEQDEREAKELGYEHCRFVTHVNLKV